MEVNITPDHDSKDNGSSRALTYDTLYSAPFDDDLPDATTAGKTLHMLFIYNSATEKLELHYQREVA